MERTNRDLRRHAAGALAAVLAGAWLALAAPAAGQTSVSYPPSRSLPDVAAWLQRDTPILPAQVVDISPSAVTAVVSSTPTGEPHGFLATIDSEAMNPDIEAHDGIASWSIPVEVDCDRRQVRLGVMTGFRGRNLRSDPKVLRQADTAFVNPSPTAPLGAVVRALCERDFKRPLLGGRVRLAAVALEPIKPAPDPAGKPTPKSGVRASLAVQVGASPSLPDAQGLLAHVQRRFASDLAGLGGGVATAEVEGKTVHRALISGFSAVSEATALCEKLKAAGQACFVRR